MPEQMQKRAIFIAGPTASGKSALAMELAQKTGGEIINADAMQVYADLRVLTARPTVEEVARVPHHLYGVMDGAERCSAGRWAAMAAASIADVLTREHVPILTGGTGLYFKVLEEGLSPIPDIPDDVRARALRRFEELGRDAFRAEVVVRDPAMERLPAGDRQRLLRAWEVFEATGKALSWYQRQPRVPLIALEPVRLIVEPPRETLYHRCDKRAATMLDGGAIAEVEALLARGLDSDLPVMKALGVTELSTLIRGEVDEAKALGALQQATRRFAKRQLTWFRNQTPDWHRLADAADANEDLENLFSDWP